VPKKYFPGGEKRCSRAQNDPLDELFQMIIKEKGGPKMFLKVTHPN